MQKSSRKSWRQSPSQDNRDAQAGSFELPDDVYDESVALPGWSIQLGRRTTLNLDPKFFVAIFLAVALYLLAALLANEWLYLLAAGLAMVSGLGTVLPLLVVCSIYGDCWLPDGAVAEEAAEIAISLRQRRWLGPLALFLPPSLVRTRVLLARRTYAGYIREDSLSRQPLLLDSIGRQSVLKFTIPSLQRGIYRLERVEVTTSFPFGIAWWTRSFKPNTPRTSQREIVVYPRFESLTGNFLLELKGALSAMGIAFTEKLSLTQSTSVRSIRDFRVGDSLRHIHWASSARAGKLLVREFDSETLPVFDIYLNLRANWVNREQFELAVCLVNSLVNFGYEHDMLPELYLNPPLDAPELESLMFDLPSAQSPVEMLREILARVEPVRDRVVNAPPTPESDSLRQLLSIVPSTEKMWRHTPERGDHVVCPVNLTALDRAAMSDEQRAQTQQVATIFSEVELQSL